ncbi:Polyketide cyclase / dehydrase and lipid transport [Gordonia paraffinivorans]|uniref:Polyketide cyclase / dehydrase and lipid transport n=1 Tax=Gordonia paraffinivorans TaxID=175628 RepID=A0ABD7UYV3_9ACTN|nr:SRPBCC family protein [Gordonia paraffinivorans]VFA81801.1 Polyketide cyclase / dehydrase and lipid transport [Gordonia paraffinivorans]
MAGRITIVDDVVRFDAPAPTVFDYLTDPRNRAQWQSSLRRVDDVAELGDRPGDVGTSWTDVTVVPGVAPRLEVTACEPPRLWREIGTWRSVDAVLTLEFDDRDGGTDVRAQAILTVPTIGVPVLLVNRWPAARAIRADLRRAARIVADSAR